MSGASVRIEIAAGAGDDNDQFGTDATAIARAIESADDGDGVVVLMDVGSAVISAEMALDFVDPDVKERTRLIDAPFIEGAISASVTASGGGSLDHVIRDARSALKQKTDAIPGDESDGSDDGQSQVSPGKVWEASATVDVVNEHGLHARPAAQFVRLALQYAGSAQNGSVQVRDLTNGKGPVDATSQSTVTTLGAVRGHRLQIEATGEKAQAIVERLAQLVASGFDEIDTTEPDEGSASKTDLADTSPTGKAVSFLPYSERQVETALKGIAVQAGAAVGPVFVHEPEVPEVPEEFTDDPEGTWEEISTVLDRVSTRMEYERSRLLDKGHTDAADIIGAQQLLLNDPALRDRAHENIFEKGQAAPLAWMEAVETVIDAYASADDEYLSQRADDVRDVAIRVLHVLVDVPPKPIGGPDDPHILVTRRFRPSDIPQLDADTVRAVVCAEGNATSHSAILIRGRGIPAVFDAGVDVLSLRNGTEVAVDGKAGLVWIEPDASTKETVRRERAHQASQQRKAQAAAHQPAKTQSGTRIEVAANVSRSEDAARAADGGADGVGLLRTEFLFTDTDEAPSEDEQVRTLRSICNSLPGKLVTVRALDVGGDKPLSYLPLPHETNPFLGLRGIRVLLRSPDLFRTQLRAVLRLAKDHRVRLMLPMVATVDEVQQTREILDEARADLRERGMYADASLPLGTMIETPASALRADALAREVDFFSIGTNDLTQYTMAVDREHSELHGLSDALHPAVLHLIQRTVAAGTNAEIPTSVCGELAADRAAVPVLLGLGITTLSVSPNQIPDVKALVRSLDDEACRRLADEALTSNSAEDVRSRANDLLSDRAR